MDSEFVHLQPLPVCQENIKLIRKQKKKQKEKMRGFLETESARCLFQLPVYQ